MATYGVQLERSELLRLPPCPGAPAEDEFLDWCRSEVRNHGRRLAVDLFSGAGGLSLGLESAGWTVVVAVDHDLRSVETHRANFRGRALQLDLSDPDNRTELVASLAALEIDLIAGGPPCQPYSRAGSNKIRSLVEQGTRDRLDPRKELWKAYLGIVLDLRPRAVLMENVPDMGLSDDFQTVRRMVGDLERCGYATEIRIIDTWKYRVPQHRRRLILLARRDGAPFVWPEGDKEFQVSVGGAIGDLPPLGLTTGSRKMEYKEGRKLGEFAREMRRGAPEGLIHDHFTRPVRDDDRRAFEAMDSKTLYSDLSDDVKRYRDDIFDDKYKRLDLEQLSRTITAHIAKDGYWYIHPAEARTLTVREAARIQTFPDRFRFAGYRSDAFRQIGNAVPPLAGAAAAKALAPPTGDAQADEARTAHDWTVVEQRLTDWAAGLARSEAWTAIPGEAMTPLLAAACALLSRTQLVQAEDMPVLAGLRDRDRLDEEIFESRIHGAPHGNRRRLERLRRLVDVAVPDDADEAIKLLKLGTADARVYKLLLGYDTLAPSQGALRVAARFRGTRSHEKNPLTEGRIDLARLVGTGDEAPLRMAAIRHIGMTLCDPASPKCAECPLRGAGCVEAKRLADRAIETMNTGLFGEASS